jgi:hypothetical protein
MLIVDEAKIKQRLHAAKVADTQAKIESWIAEQERFAAFDDDPSTSPLNHLTKLGRPMDYREFERRCRRLNPSICFWCGPRSYETNHKNMGRQIGPDKYEVVTFVPMDIMPERSMHRKCEEWVPDGDMVDTPMGRAEVVPHVSDYGSTEWVPLPGEYQHVDTDGNPVGPVTSFESHWEPNGKGIGRWAQKDPDKRPGWRKRVSAWGEWKRGWRSLLIRAVVARLLTPQQVENEFLADNTPEWKGNMGKGPKTTPW